MKTARLRNLSQTVEIRRLKGPALTAHDIALRLATLVQRLERKAGKGHGLDPEEARLLAGKLRVYARRLARLPREQTRTDTWADLL